MLVTMLLNHVVLAPGEAMYVDAGVVHAYASGIGVEIMAASDNVLRAGLTPKHRDVAELLSVTDFTPIPPPRWEPEVVSGARTFGPPVSEFELQITHGDLSRSGEAGPVVVLCLEPTTITTSEDEPVTLQRGDCLFVPHGIADLRADGGTLAVGRVPG